MRVSLPDERPLRGAGNSPFFGLRFSWMIPKEFTVMAPFQILRAYRLLAILWMAVGFVSETASDGHGMRVATVGFPTIYQGAATLRTSRTNRFTYTVAGMIDHVDTVDSSGTLRTTYYKYDDARRRRQADSPEGVLTWQRDAQGNIIAMQGYRRSAVTTNAEVTGGTTTDVDVAYGYDAMNRLSSVTDRKVSTTRSLGYAFDAAGRVQTATYPNGVTNRFTYDTRHRLLKTDWWQTNGTLMRAFSYTLGAGGVRVAVNESDPTNSNRRSISWQYDVNGTNQLARLYRLTSETITNLGSLGTEQHLYDLVGNRLSRSATGFITNSVPTNSAWTDNARDELVVDTYDGAGNTTLGTSLSLANTDSYDAENHLILRGTNTSPVVQIDYDAFGNRVKKTVNSGTPIWYLIDDQSPSGYPQVVAEFNSLSSAPLRTYAYGLSLIDIVSSGTTSYALTDGQGSVRALFSDTSAASLTDNYDFDAYGVLTANSGSTVNNYRYTGQQWDPDLQLYYLRARYYAPTLGRFWSSDSFEGRHQDPESLHKYLYGQGNPVSFIDPSGHGEELSGLMANMYIRAMAAANYAMRASSVFNYRAAYSIFRLQQNLWKVELALAGLNLGVAGAEWLDSAAQASLNNNEVSTDQNGGNLFERVVGANATQYEAIDHIVYESDGKKSVFQLVVRSDNPTMTDDVFISRLRTSLVGKMERMYSARKFEPRIPGTAPIIDQSEVVAKTVVGAIPETRGYLIGDSRIIALMGELAEEYPSMRTAVLVLRNWRPLR